MHSHYLAGCMILLGETLISEDILDKHFICDLGKCKGACCVEGDFGAPLEKEEIKSIKKELKNILPFLNKASVKNIKDRGFHEKDDIGEPVTTCLPTGECNFSFRDETGILNCGIEKAWQAGKSTFRKPVSCHLYPIRVNKVGAYDALNYNRWDICKPACRLGEKHSMPLFRFLKDALIRRFGKGWYEELEQIFNSRK